MKIKFSTLAVGLLLGMLCVVASCSRDFDLDNRVSDLEEQMIGLDETQLPSLQEQITMLTTFKTQLENILPQQLAAFQGEIDGLETEMNGTFRQNLINDIKGMYDNAISTLENQVKALQDGKLDAATFEEYKESTAGTLKTLEESITALSGTDEKLQGDIQKILGYLSGCGLIDEENNTNNPFTYTDGVAKSLRDELMPLIQKNIEDIDANSKDIKALKDSIDSHDARLKALAELTGVLEGYYNNLANDLAQFKLDVAKDYLTKNAFNEYKESAEAKAKAFASKMKADSTVFAQGIEANKLAIEALEAAHVRDSLRINAAEGRLDNVEDSIEAQSAKINENIENIKALRTDVDQILDETIPAINESIDSLVQEDIKLANTIQDVVDNKIIPLENDVYELSEDLDSLKNQVSFHKQLIKDIYIKVGKLENEVKALRGMLINVADLIKNRIQSLVYVPDYNDGLITINGAVIKYGTGETLRIQDVKSKITYKVRPANLADSIADAWQAKKLFARFDAVTVKTRVINPDTVTLDIVNIESVGKNGDIIVTVDLADSTMASVERNAVALVLLDKKANSRSTEYTGLKADNDVELTFCGDNAYEPEEISKEYIDATTAELFKTKEALFEVHGAKKTVAEIKSQFGWDIAKYIVGDVDYAASGDAALAEQLSSSITSDTTLMNSAINPGDYMTMTLSSNKTEAAKAVGKTINAKKLIYLLDEKGDTIDTTSVKGSFKVTSIKLEAKLKASVAWNFDEDVKGDRMLFIEKNDSFAYKNKNIPVSIVSENITSKGSYSAADFSHMTPVDGTVSVKKYVKGNPAKAIALSADQNGKFKVAPKMDKTAGTLSLDSLAGFNFNDSIIIVSAKYALGQNSGDQDTVSVELAINLTDRYREMFTHTFETVKIKVTPDFGGELKYAIYGDVEKSKYAGTYDYFKEAIQRYGNTKAEDFAAKWNWTSIYVYVGSAIKQASGDSNGIVNTKDSLIVKVPYDVADITGAYASGFTLKDTVTTGYGQQIELIFPVQLEWPVYNFKHNQFFVVEGPTGFYSEVKPLYEGTDGKSNPSVLAKYNVEKIDMFQNFSIVDANGNKVADPASNGLTVKYNLVSPNGNVIIDNGLVNYQDSLETVGVKGTITMKVDGVDFNLRTNFDEGGKYSNYCIHRYMPFASFTPKGAASITVNEIKKYSINILQYVSLKDTRTPNKECLDYTKPDKWVMGTGSNGFANGISAKTAYAGDDFALSISKTGIPEEIASKIHFGVETDGEDPYSLYFNYDGQQYLQKDINIPVTVSFKNKFSGTMKTTINVTFKSEKN